MLASEGYWWLYERRDMICTQGSEVATHYFFVAVCLVRLREGFRWSLSDMGRYDIHAGFAFRRLYLFYSLHNRTSFLSTLLYNYCLPCYALICYAIRYTCRSLVRMQA